MPSSIIENMTENHLQDDSCESDAELLNNLPNNGNRNILKSSDPHRRLSLNLLNNHYVPKNIDPFFEPKVLLKNDSISRSESSGSLLKESKVLVIYTGGTIGMVKNNNGGNFHSTIQFEKFLLSTNSFNPSPFNSLRTPTRSF